MSEEEKSRMEGQIRVWYSDMKDGIVAVGVLFAGIDEEVYKIEQTAHNFVCVSGATCELEAIYR